MAENRFFVGHMKLLKYFARDGSQDFCREYVYPEVDMYPHVDSKDAMNPSGAGYYPYTGMCMLKYIIEQLNWLIR